MMPVPPLEPERWNPFEVLVETAQSWVTPGSSFIPISEIAFVTERTHGGLWYPPTTERPSARITLGWKEGLPLAWHEVFHSVFGRSYLRKYDPAWTEGWCNAFAEIHHRYFHAPDSKRLLPGTHGRDEYVTPCYLLCDSVNYSADRLKQLWFDWNSYDTLRAPGAFTEFMRYDPLTGRLW